MIRATVQMMQSVFRLLPAAEFLIPHPVLDSPKLLFGGLLLLGFIIPHFEETCLIFDGLAAIVFDRPVNEHPNKAYCREK